MTVETYRYQDGWNRFLNASRTSLNTSIPRQTARNLSFRARYAIRGSAACQMLDICILMFFSTRTDAWGGSGWPLGRSRPNVQPSNRARPPLDSHQFSCSFFFDLPEGKARFGAHFGDPGLKNRDLGGSWGALVGSLRG